MAIGLLLILSVGGYFAWTEVQAGQVRSELDVSAADAAARATRVAQVLAQATPTADVQLAAAAGTPGNSAETAAAAKAALSATPRTILPEPTRTRQASATRRATPTRAVIAQVTTTEAPTATAEPTSAPAATPQPAAPEGAATEGAAPVRVAPVRMAIPDLKIDTKVVEMGWEVKQTKNGPVSEWVIPKNVAGHHLNSAGIGQPDNLVISGHNNIYGRVFMPISQAWNNDKRVKVDNFTDKSSVLDGREVILYDAAGTAYTYIITEFYRLKDTGVSQQQRIANGRNA
jgi:sortase (surface protein transpeptidase)